MLVKFKTWLFSRLPRFFLERDSNKDYDGQGTLERFLKIHGEELDDELVPFIDNITDLLSLETIQDKYLMYLGFTLGSPPDIDGTSDSYRKLLTYIVRLYKIKGTLCSLRLLFNLMGLDIAVQVKPRPTAIRHDLGFTYDEEPLTIHDIACQPCYHFDLVYWNYHDDPLIPIINPVDPILLNKILKILCFVQPIDTRLDQLARGINFRETYTPNPEDFTEVVTTQILVPIIYDNNYTYDDGLAHDYFI